MKNKDVVSAVIGSSFFAVPYLALSIPLAPSLIIGTLAFVGGELVISKDEKQSLRELDNDLYKMVISAKKDVKHISNKIKEIDSDELKKVIKSLVNNASKILIAIEEQPTKVKNINNFFDYYLPVTVKIIDRYDKIENQKINTSDTSKFNNNILNMLIEMDNAFEKILNNMYASDMLDTDIEMKVLNKMLKQDGYSKDEFKVNKEDRNG